MIKQIKKVIKYFGSEAHWARYRTKQDAAHNPLICYRFEPLENITSYEAAVCIKAITLTRYAVDRKGAIISEKAFDNLDEKAKRHWISDKTVGYT